MNTNGRTSNWRKEKQGIKAESEKPEKQIENSLQEPLVLNFVDPALKRCLYITMSITLE